MQAAVFVCNILRQFHNQTLKNEIKMYPCEDNKRCNKSIFKNFEHIKSRQHEGKEIKSICTMVHDQFVIDLAKKCTKLHYKQKRCMKKSMCTIQVHIRVKANDG